MRSVRKGDLEEPSSKMGTYEDRSFAACAPRMWNSLPLSIHRSSSVDIYKNVLKTYIFKLFINEVCKCSLFIIHFVFAVKRDGQFIGVVIIIIIIVIIIGLGGMAAMLCDVVVPCACPQAMPLAIFTMRKAIRGFL